MDNEAVKPALQEASDAIGKLRDMFPAGDDMLRALVRDGWLLALTMAEDAISKIDAGLGESVQAAVNKERERCALIAEMSPWRTAAGEIAAAIRATPKKERGA